MSVCALPTKRDEAWRYADLTALARVWPLKDGPELICVPAGEAQLLLLEHLPMIDGVVVRDIHVELGAGARFALFIALTGAEYGRLSITAKLGAGAHFELGGAIVGQGSETLEIISRVIHAEPQATSNQTIRNVLSGHATGTYLGKVEVARHAQKTDASQSVKSLLLDRFATANAVPQLEIYADDVKCAHGATVGELDKAAEFYMASRGLDADSARRLLIRAFLGDAFVALEDADAAERLLERAVNALGGRA